MGPSLSANMDSSMANSKMVDGAGDDTRRSSMAIRRHGEVGDMGDN